MNNSSLYANYGPEKGESAWRYTVLRKKAKKNTSFK